MKARCNQCGEKPARPLKSLPGAYGRVLAYCSLRCAAKSSLERFLCGALEWCERHETWEDDEAQRECHKENDRSSLD